MKQYISKAAVVAEIERRISDNKKDIERASHKNLEDYFEGYEDALALLKQQYLDTLEVKEVEEEPVSNDLEAEFVLYLKHKFNIPQEGNKLKTDGWRPSPYDLLDIAKHFAQWQKEQLMENAVEAVIHPYDGEIWVDKDLLSIYDDCQRVKLIIIKEK